MTEPADYQAIRFERDRHVALLTLDRPERMNAWTDRMGAELSDAMARCDAFSPTHTAGRTRSSTSLSSTELRTAPAW